MDIGVSTVFEFVTRAVARLRQAAGGGGHE
jgi:hypothetical protein